MTSRQIEEEARLSPIEMQESGRGGGAARIAGWTGIAFAVLFVIGFVLAAQVPAYDAADAEWIRYVEDGGERARTVAGGMALAAAGIALMAFTAAIARVVGDDRPGAGDPWVEVLRGAGVMAGVTLTIAALAGAAVSAALTFTTDFPTPTADTVRILDQLGLGILLIGTGWSTAVVVACTSRLAARRRSLPGWLTIAGQLAAVLLLVSFMFLPIVLLPLWVLVTAVTLLATR